MRTFVVSALLAAATFASGTAAQAQTATQDINITASVASYCTINNITNPTDLDEVIPVTNGIVDTSVISNTIGSVACNSPADVIATSLSGGVTTIAAAEPGTTNIIDYTAVATFSGATSTIDTSDVATAAGSEAGNTATTASAATGNLVVTITPAQPAQLLMPSTDYEDTLRVTLTAQ